MLIRTRPTAGRTDRPGAAAVELAVLLPFLAFLTVNAIDCARLFYFTISVNECARAGAIYLCDPMGVKQSPYASVDAAAKAESPNLTNLTVTSANSTDANGNKIARVTVSMPFRTITNYNGKYNSTLSWSWAPSTISRTVEVRILPLATR